MTVYYVGPGGNDGNSGLTWALRKLTLNGAEDVPVAAGDTIYVGTGVYRETLTIDVSGGAGTPITYIGDVTGENTDGVGGIVRITGSNNDQTAARANCILDSAKNYRTFRGFLFDTTSNMLLNVWWGSDWIIEDCVLEHAFKGIYFCASVRPIVRRCLILAMKNEHIHFGCPSVAGRDALVENCLSIAPTPWASHILAEDYGDVLIKNCNFIGGQVGVTSWPGMTLGQVVTVNNCILQALRDGLHVTSGIVGEIVENFNNFFNNNTDRVNVAVGANSVAYSPLQQPPLLYSGAGQVSGFQFPWWFGLLSEWSQVRAITGVGEPSVDLLGIGRPTTAAKNSWGPLQFHDMERDTGTVFAGAASMEISDAGRIQFKVPTTNRRYTVRAWVRREANYAGVNPQLVIKQPGQADRTTTDAGAAGAWNVLEDSFVPATLPPYLFIELVSNNTAVAANIATYFDRLAVRGSPLDTGEMEQWLWDRQPLEDYGKVTPVVKKDVEGNIYSEVNTRGDLLRVAP